MCARFVQVGNEAFNMDLITHVVILSETLPEVRLEYVNEDGGILVGEQAERFLAWWYYKADVYKA